ncbi:putative RNA-directed DNA polymerase from transposon BS [Nephila pilipes]|uniref:Putative RNA-directed DNA polymerase from transposon BS n=1 Tax=Nephila pilipes TaxID=299642 RepID=A0A8X6NFS7_NEPPI|nr:putative RNA-directed DNA polymerase from transposon BS [Nephila pilipes]
MSADFSPGRAIQGVRAILLCPAKRHQIYLVRIIRKISNLEFSEADRFIKRRVSSIIHGCRSFTEDFGMHELDAALHDTHLRKSPGSDKIQMTDHLNQDARLRVLEIINISWSSGRLPRYWKRATVISIRKP